jgi:multiple sugar transport system permease protein
MAIDAPAVHTLIAGAILGLAFAYTMLRIVGDLPHGDITRHEFEAAVLRFLIGFGYIFFVAIVLIPFYVMVMTSLKNQAELMQNPLDFSIDLSKGWELFRSYANF